MERSACEVYMDDSGKGADRLYGKGRSGGNNIYDKEYVYTAEDTAGGAGEAAAHTDYWSAVVACTAVWDCRTDISSYRHSEEEA